MNSPSHAAGILPPTLLASRVVMVRELGRGGMARSTSRARRSTSGRSPSRCCTRNERGVRRGAFPEGDRHRRTAVASHLVPPTTPAMRTVSLLHLGVRAPAARCATACTRSASCQSRTPSASSRRSAPGWTSRTGRDCVHRDVSRRKSCLPTATRCSRISGSRARLAQQSTPKDLTARSDEAMTQPGIALGTPAYMSPEQAAGEGERTRGSDIYSLACVLYEMRFGEPPFAAVPRAR